MLVLRGLILQLLIAFTCANKTFKVAVYANPITTVVNATSRGEALTAITANLDGLAKWAKRAKKQVSPRVNESVTSNN